MIDGELYVVSDLTEVQALLARYLEQQRAQLAVAEPAHQPAIRAKITRAEKRADRVQVSALQEAQRQLDALAKEDDEILMLMIMH